MFGGLGYYILRILNVRKNRLEKLKNSETIKE